MKRIIMHWTAGGGQASSVDREHYHFIVEADGDVVRGDLHPEANMSTSDADGYAAHTRGCNTGSIGVALAGMLDARESPFSPGPYPLTVRQVDEMVSLVANLAQAYDIPVTRQTILSHAEVQPTLGIPQRGKWDITWLPGMAKPGNPVEVGDRLRQRIKDAMTGKALAAPQKPASAPVARPATPVAPAAASPVLRRPWWARWLLK